MAPIERRDRAGADGAVDARVTSALIGASRPEQLVENVGALQNLTFSAEELAEIDRHAVEGGINLWEKPSTDWQD